MTHMKDLLKYQNCISKLRRAGANASLALVAVLASAAITAPPARAQTFTVLHTFDSTDGGDLVAPLAQATMETCTEPPVKVGPTAPATSLK